MQRKNIQLFVNKGKKMYSKIWAKGEYILNGKTEYGRLSIVAWQYSVPPVVKRIPWFLVPPPHLNWPFSLQPWSPINTDGSLF